MAWRNIRNMKAVITFKSGDKLLEVFNRAGVGWTVTKYSESGSTLRKLFVKGFSTKSKALSYAKAHMRTH